MATLLMAQRPWPFDRITFSALVLVGLVAIILTRFHLRHTPIEVGDSRTAERIIWLVAILSVCGVQLVTRSLGRPELLGIGFLLMAPLVAQAMLVSALLGPTISIFALTVVAFMLGIGRALPVDTLAASWLAGAVGSHAVNPLKQRSDLVRASSIQLLAQAVIAFCVAAAAVSDVRLVLESAGWAAVAAIGSTSLFWLAVTVLERIFGIISDWSLLELCSPEHPLINELCLRAPGTYAHSVMVGNLAEQAARLVGANPVVCRAMAYFHDVGKLNRPSYFLENQIGRNIHDELPPALSAMSIAAHVRDGLELAQQYRLPRIIRDGIAQHHGTSLIQYFYNRALAEPGFDHDDASIERTFRYEGPKPQSKEAAILLLADSVEAASRSIGRGSSEELEIMVRKIVEDRRADGQLDDCDLTFRDLNKVEHSFLRTLGALRHERIAYDEETNNAQAKTPWHLDLERFRNPIRPEDRRNLID